MAVGTAMGQSGGAEAVSFAREFLDDAAGETAARQAAGRVLDEVRRLGLESQAWELDCQGYTVLPPESVASAQFIDELRRITLDTAAASADDGCDPADDDSYSTVSSPFGQVRFSPGLLFSHQIYERALMNERVLALVRYLLGESCVLNHFSSMLKGPGADYLPLHTDQNQSGGPPPYPAYAQVANATWALTDYTKDGGAICFVPGSHRLCRPPTPQEAVDIASWQPLEVAAGSVIVWHGNTWHGAFPRRDRGVRISLVEYFTRWYLVPFEPYHAMVTTDMLDRNRADFATLMGLKRLLPQAGTVAENYPLSMEAVAAERQRAAAARISLFA
jgi:ectoine hydroxylase-related dioxygenase (phytanoyl-CoA dioxygenase family)